MKAELAITLGVILIGVSQLLHYCDHSLHDRHCPERNGEQLIF